MIRISSSMWAPLVDHQCATVLVRVLHVWLCENFCNRFDRGVSEALK
jgi:hypothetical protein